MPQDSRFLNYRAMYRAIQSCDPRYNRMICSQESLVKAQQKIDTLLSILNRDIPETQYVLAHARDVRRQLDQYRDLLKSSWSVELPPPQKGKEDGPGSD